jgi:glycosyltransferase involved in cell wall biosynthesis
MPHISVIVPVFDPREAIDECITSLLAQTMPAGDLELIFVDDGSTDGTGERLDALAAEHAHVRVAHIPNSGWPGRPRNIGMDMARGEFVYFVDDDDWLEPDAVERLHAAAVEDDADVVIGKVVGHGKKLPRELFRESIRGGAFHPRLLALLTPHKLFRRAMLEAHAIRFPEGRVRLEDHLFVVHAYFHARAISVLADRPYYHWALRVDPKRNASYSRIEPERYFASLREVLDLVEAHTEPGPFREALLAHWYRGKMLGRLTGAFAKRDEAYARPLLDTIRGVALDRYGDGVDERLAYNLRVRSALLRRGDAGGLRALARFESALRARIRARVGCEDGELSLRLTASLDGLDFARDGERVRWVVPEELRAAVGSVGADATEALGASHVQVCLHSVRDASEYLLPATSVLDLGDDPASARPRLRVRVTSLATAAAGGPLPAGDWELRAVVHVAGFSHARSVRRNGAPVVLTTSRQGRDPGWAAGRRATGLLRRIRARRGLVARRPAGSVPARGFG